MTRWRTISEWPNYEVSDDGRVRNAAGLIMQLDYDRFGYRRVKLSRQGYRKNKRVHVLVAQAFLDWYEGCDVNHMGRDKNNNAVDNLEITSHQENMRHWMADEGRLLEAPPF